MDLITDKKAYSTTFVHNLIFNCIMHTDKELNVSYQALARQSSNKVKISQINGQILV